MTEQDFIIQPQENLSPTQVFDKGCYESRLKELTELVLAKLIEEDQKQDALEHKRQFKDVPPYPYEEKRALFYEKAKGEAQKIIEAERKKVVEARKNYIQDTLNLIIRQAKLLVFTEHGKGKIIRKKEPITGVLPKDSLMSFADVFYFEDCSPMGKQLFEQISWLKTRLSEFEDYVPYMDSETLSLWQQANKLLDLEVVDADAEKEKSTVQPSNLHTSP